MSFCLTRFATPVKVVIEPIHWVREFWREDTDAEEVLARERGTVYNVHVWHSLFYMFRVRVTKAEGLTKQEAEACRDELRLSIIKQRPSTSSA